VVPFLLAIACVFQFISQEKAQIAGRVVDVAKGEPLAAASIRIGGVTLTSDAQGRFRVAMLPGTIPINVELVGYGTVADSIRISSTGVHDLEVRLSRKPVVLPPLTVIARSARLTETGFYERRDRSGLSGRFLTRVEIEKSSPMQLTDLFRNVSGVKVDYAGVGRRVVRFPRAMPGCEDPTVFVDGRPYNSRELDGLSPNIIEAMEIYVHNAPIEYKSPCGTIVIWLRRGPWIEQEYQWKTRPN
jgi:hypothetical protein